MFSFVSIKVLFVDVHSVVLVHATLHHWDELFHCVLIIILFLSFLAVALGVALFSEIDVLGPSTFFMQDTRVLKNNSFSVGLRLTKHRSVVGESGAGGANLV